MSKATDPSKKTRFAVAAVAFLSVIAARWADLATTLHFNPTLSREANPFVSVFGLDTTQLIVTNVIGILAFVLAPLLAYVRYAPASMEQTPQTLAEYISIQLYRCNLEKKRLYHAIFLGWPLPKDWLQTTRLFGFTVSWTVVFASLVATFGWWATNQCGMEWYQAYRSLFSIRGYPVIEFIPIIVCIYIAGYLYFRMEFREYELNLSSTEQ